MFLFLFHLSLHSFGSFFAIVVVVVVVGARFIGAFSWCGNIILGHKSICRATFQQLTHTHTQAHILPSTQLIIIIVVLSWGYLVCFSGEMSMRLLCILLIEFNRMEYECAFRFQSICSRSLKLSLAIFRHQHVRFSLIFNRIRFRTAF